jgi:hypothetical protein
LKAEVNQSRSDVILILGFVVTSLLFTAWIQIKAAEPLGKQIGAITVIGVLFTMALIKQQGTQVFSSDHGRQLSISNEKSAIVRLRLEPGGLIRFDVDLGTIPMDTEVTANF